MTTSGTSGGIGNLTIGQGAIGGGGATGSTQNATVSSRTLSWAQLVRNADPNWNWDSLHPWVYEFSNGRFFLDPSPLY